jgi:hypothetical protein
MYRLPKDADLSFLQGVALLQVCVGRNELILNFDRDVRVTILSEFAVGSSDAPFTTYTDPISGAHRFFAVLQDTVTSATATSEGHLCLSFSSGMGVEVRDTSDEFESFWIKHGDQQIIV